MNIIFNSVIDKDTIGIATANIVTPVAVGITLMNPVTILTIVSILTSIILNGVLIYKNLKKKNYQETTEEK